MCDSLRERKWNNSIQKKRPSKWPSKWKLAMAQFNHNQVIVLSSTVGFKYPRVCENDGKTELVLKLQRLIISQDNHIHYKNLGCLVLGSYRFYPMTWQGSVKCNLTRNHFATVKVWCKSLIKTRKNDTQIDIEIRYREARSCTKYSVLSIPVKRLCLCWSDSLPKTEKK